MLLKNECLICFFNLVGLVDAETDEEFIAQLESFKEVWDTRERENLPPTNVSKFLLLHFGESYIT